MKQYTMYDVLKALEFELGGFAAAREIFEWYCKTYRVTVGDPAPATIVWEVFGE